MAEDDVAVTICDACVAVLNEVNPHEHDHNPLNADFHGGSCPACDWDYDNVVRDEHGKQVRLKPTDVAWAHDSVRASFPSGTDPRLAMRAALGVFMERTDGTNAMQWWQQVRWWHGGQRKRALKRGVWLLPPSQTGVVPGMENTDRDSVYVTSSRDDAIMYAARFHEPMLYEVTLRAEPLPDDLLPDVETSKRVPTALIVRCEVPSRVELFSALRALAD